MDFARQRSAWAAAYRGLFRADGEAPAPAATRVAAMDNARFALVALVVVGHFIEPYTHTSRFLFAVWVGIYSFHVPMLALISGFFSGATLTRADFGKLVGRLLAPYLIFQTALDGFAFLLHPANGLHLHWLKPGLALWYLPCLVAWRLLLPLFARIRHRIAAAVLLYALLGLVGEIRDYYPALKTFALFPFFAAGYGMRRDVAERLRSPWIVWTGLGALAAWLVAAPLLGDAAMWGLWHDSPHARFGWPVGVAALYQLALLAVSFATGLAFLALVPRGVSRVTEWGAGSLYPYLLHIFPAYLGMAATHRFAPYLTTTAAQVALMAAAVALAAVLATKPVRRVARPFVEPAAYFRKR